MIISLSILLIKLKLPVLNFQIEYRMFHQCKTKQKIHPEWAFLNVRQKIKLKSLLWAHRQYHVTSAFYLIRYTTQSYYLQFWHQLTSLCRWYTNLDVCIRYRHEYLKTYHSIRFVAPVLFTLYTTPLRAIISSFDINRHLYADDTHI